MLYGAADTAQDVFLMLLLQISSQRAPDDDKSMKRILGFPTHCTSDKGPTQMDTLDSRLLR
jgi:hypothetical protein